MASSLKIEETITADIKNLLDAAEVANVVSATSEQPEAATFVRIAVLNMRSNLAGGNVPYGNRQADIAVECFSYFDDDKTGAALATLASDVRIVIYKSTILADLNTASTYNYYFGMLAGDDIPDQQERYRIISIQFSLIMRPEKT